MFSKNALPKLDDEPDPHRRLRTNVRDLFLTNQISAERAASLLQDAAQAGVQALDDVQCTSGRNLHRDLLRKFAKKAKGWPKVYWAHIDFFHPKKQIVQKEWLAMLLPHEWLLSFRQHVQDPDRLATWSGLGPQAQAECFRACRELGCSQLIPLSLWCDGVPYNWDRSQSLEVMNLALPGIPEWHNLRIPFTAFDHKRIAPGTFDQIFSVLVWSLQSLATGCYPLQRHNHEPWISGDEQRQKLAGQQHGLRAALTLVKADWKAFKEIFSFPGWQGNEGICWLCTATLTDMRTKATTMHQNLNHWSFLQRQVFEYQKPVSQLLAAPTLRIHQFRPDWLHTMDQGCTADFLGNLFLWIIIPKLEGRNQAERIRQLFLLIEKYYSDNVVQQRYNNLTLKMLQKKPGQTPKLRGRASEVKGLVPFGKQVADMYCSSSNPVEHTVKVAANHFKTLYDIVWTRHAFNPQAMRTESFKLRQLLQSLDAHHADTSNKWRLKPKLHLMEELCEKQTDNPLDHSTYRDEDWGGAAARWAKRRGGTETVSTISRNVITKFCANNRLPKLA